MFACGNVLHVHDLVDYVSEEAALAGENAAVFAKEGRKDRALPEVELKGENGVRYTVPQKLNVKEMPDEILSLIHI